jgi:vacuolar-type H+-ATPase subunit E/Vma4
MWPAALVALLCAAGAIAWMRVRRRRSAAAAAVAGPRGLDPQPEPDVLALPAPRRRASTAVQVRKLMEDHLFEGSDRMNFRPRDETAATTPETNSSRPSYESVGDRITSLLEAAEDAAEDIRKTAKQEAEDLRAEAERYSAEVRRRADTFAADKQAAAQADAERILREAEDRASRIEESAVEHRKNLVAEAHAVQELLEDRRRWLQEMIGAFRDVTGRLEGVVAGPESADAEPMLHGDVDGHSRPSERSWAEAVETSPL